MFYHTVKKDYFFLCCNNRHAYIVFLLLNIDKLIKGV